LYRHEVSIGSQVYVKSVEVTSMSYGANSEMKQMIGRFYPVLDFTTDYDGAILKHHSCGSTFSFKLEDLTLTPVVKKGPTKQIKVDTKVQAKFDETLLAI